MTMNDSTRTNRVKNKDGVTARRSVSRAAIIARRETTSKPCSSEKFGELQQIPNLQHVLGHRKDVLQAAPDGLGITVEDGEPCEHCDAKLLGKESNGICCSTDANGRKIFKIV